MQQRLRIPAADDEMAEQDVMAVTAVHRRANDSQQDEY
jgi:hypothetical protein